MIGCADKGTGTLHPGYDSFSINDLAERCPSQQDIVLAHGETLYGMGGYTKNSGSGKVTIKALDESESGKASSLFSEQGFPFAYKLAARGPTPRKKELGDLKNTYPEISAHD